ncbi:zinc ABC transporter substrate-binding protein ZnuA [Candidatus Erwinia haradaeae]|uniref:High-affinity zinc uptake system protein ZnuA n=1 Tax=Candidatus Erwinia haradaeae TaxID=1922217 RepID=A0A451DMH0_9GAMM|nr:zinc ABC transporter substrate-binding protein ZnuA [Candidatus Erwinia haradaeae]VFP87954.1 High-affinity zinc uptake system protein ZnuA [Candidatus Erwinia haradaeae]
MILWKSLKRVLMLVLGIFIAFLSFTTRATIIASIKPIGFIAASIADGLTLVKILLPEGASVHNYALRPSDIKHLQEADLVVWVGPEMESFMKKPLEKLPTQNTIEISQLPGVQSLLLLNKLYKGSKYINPLPNIENHIQLTNHEYRHYHSKYNMHLWMSPDIALQIAIAIHSKLLEYMPENQDQLNANLQYFKASILTMNKTINQQLLPLKDRSYFVFHDAYTYFEKYYSLIPTGYFTINPEIQPGAQRLHYIKMQLLSKKTQCVFTEPQFQPIVVKAISRGTNVRFGTLDPLGTEISISKDSYIKFLLKLSTQYSSCLQED